VKIDQIIGLPRIEWCPRVPLPACIYIDFLNVFISVFIIYLSIYGFHQPSSGVSHARNHATSAVKNIE
jgi:hypothetical protein